MSALRILVAAVLFAGCSSRLLPADDPLAAGFAAPPAVARPLVWWHWINGNVSKAGIEADLADMKRVGIAGVQMFDVSIYLPPGPVRYGTDRWHEHVQHAIRTAAKFGLEFHVMNTPGWSASGGPWVTPERSMKKLVWSETPAAGGGALALSLAQPETKLGFYRDITVLAVPADATRRLPDLPRKTKLADGPINVLPADFDPAGGIGRAQILDLSAGFDGATGALRATLPTGHWTILRFGFTSTGAKNHPAVPEGQGFEIDKLDAAAVSYYFDQALGRMLREAGPLAGRTFKAILFDSFEGGPQNWNETFPAQFAALRGYDLIPLLPALTGRVIESAALTEAVLRDFRGAVEELIARNYFGTMQRRAHEYGLITYAEAQGGPLNPVSCAEYVDVPMNEFWMPEAAPRYPRIKLVASVANVLGRGIVAAESFTATPENGRWQGAPARFKVAGDTAWTAGINRFILHHYTHQPTDDGPGFGLGRYGSNFGRLNSWWPLAAGWIDYVARSQFLLQQGRTVADVCFLQNEDHGYAFPAAMAVVPAGYDFDIVYPRHLAAMAWRDGALTLPTGPAYRILILPENWAADLPTLRKVRDLARAGAPIVGPAPMAPAGVKDCEAGPEYRALVEELWGAAGATRPALVRRATAGLEETLPARGIAPDVAWPPHPAAARGGEFRHLHRRTAEADIYFVFNHSDLPVTGDVTFRVTGRRPELWDAVAGFRADAPVFRPQANGTSVPLQLEPYGSTFVVFRRPLPARWVESTTPAMAVHRGGLLAPAGGGVELRAGDGSVTKVTIPPGPAPLPVAGPWRVAFEPGRGAPAEISLASLRSWPECEDSGVRFFSGVATYRTTFAVPGGALPGMAAFLDLGTVADLAEVRLNGTTLGGLWQPPFRIEITGALRPGENALEVRVANRWINRIIGDESIPTELTYQPPGKNKFTDGRLEALPGWLYDRARIGEKRRVSFTTWKHYDADSPLVAAGLLGPVRIEWRAVVAP